MKYIDNFLNKITMYRLVLYVLTAFWLLGLVLSFFDLLSFTPQALLYSSVIILIVAWVTNGLFAQVYKTHANIESVYISAFILALLITPPAAGEYLNIVPFLVWVTVLTMASKFILAINKKHFFNPVAIALVIMAIAANQSATWWIGTLYMLPAVLIGGLLVTRKIRRFDLVLTFLFVALITIVLTSLQKPNLTNILRQAFIDSPLFFFAFIMLTEPLTTPATRLRRMIYATIVGIGFAPAAHIASLYFTPEIALCVGNIYSFLASPMRKFMLTLKSSEKIATDTGEFVFESDHKINFRPGQYMEWTLAHPKPDTRGNRRYFTIASSPTESDVRLGVKFFPKSSTWKTALAAMEPGQTMLAGQLSGDFTLPKDPKKKLVFVAGGIGVTPFRSMVKYLVDKNEKRDIVLMYSNNLMSEIAYADLWAEAEETIGLKTVCTLTNLDKVPENWRGYKGFVNAAMIEKEIPDYAERVFYVSGPHSMVTALSGELAKLGVSGTQIKKDFFPGFV